MIERISSVIPVERIQQLMETKTLEEIQRMSYEEMVAGQPRPR